MAHIQLLMIDLHYSCFVDKNNCAIHSKSPQFQSTLSVSASLTVHDEKYTWGTGKILQNYSKYTAKFK